MFFTPLKNYTFKVGMKSKWKTKIIFGGWNTIVCIINNLSVHFIIIIFYSFAPVIFIQKC